MRILALITDAFGQNGGIAQFNRDLLRAVCTYPNCEEVVAVAYSGCHPVESLPAKLTFKTKGIDNKIKYVLSVLSQLTYNSKFDLILCGHIHLLPAAFLSRFFGVRAPIVLTVYGVDAWRPTRSWIANRLAKKIDAFISISNVTEKKFLDWAKINATRRFLLPASIEMDHFGRDAPNSRLLDRYGLLGRTVLMTLGRLSARDKYKGVDQVLELIPELAREIPNVAYLIVGDGDDRTRLEEKAKALGIKNQVIFTGFIDESEKADHLRLADAFVMPGWGEGFGIVYLEALACGVPVVASKADGSREAVLNGQLGILVDPENPEEIKAGILEALKKPKGIVPAALSYFSYENFETRLHQILDKFFVNTGAKLSVSSRRLTPIHPVEKFCRWIRHLPWLERLRWIWESIRPSYDRFSSFLYPTGVTWNINGTDPIVLSPCLRMISENHEPQAWKIIMSEVKAGDTVADVGAHVGIYTVALAKRVGKSGRIVAFEPDPLNFNLLRRHVDLNVVDDRVELMRVAVNARGGHVQFCFGKDGYSHVSPASANDTCLVECASIDQVFSNKKLDLMKIDVEGYEEEVLKGASSLLKDKSRGPRIMYIELHPWAWKQVGVESSNESILRILGQCNYRVLSLEGQPADEIESLEAMVAYRRNG